jgi:hypothetical protein
MRLAFTMSASFSERLKFEAGVLDISLIAHCESLIRTGLLVLKNGWPPYSLHELEATGFLRSPSAKLYRVVSTKGGNILNAAADVAKLYESEAVECPQGRLDTALILRRALYMGWRGT